MFITTSSDGQVLFWDTKFDNKDKKAQQANPNQPDYVKFFMLKNRMSPGKVFLVYSFIGPRVARLVFLIHALTTETK